MDGAGGAAAALTVTEASAGEAVPEALPTHLDMVLKTIYWRRFDGAVLLRGGGDGDRRVPALLYLMPG